MSDEGAGRGDGDDNGSVPIPAELVEVIPPELRDVIKTPEQLQALMTVVTQVTTVQSTRGNYPPPAMMAEYKKIDPAINNQILAEAKAQAEHRRSLEKLATEGSEKRLSSAQTNQNWVAIGGLIVPVVIVLLLLWFKVEVSWTIAVVLILLCAVAIGGRPAATILTAYIAKNVKPPTARD